MEQEPRPAEGVARPRHSGTSTGATACGQAEDRERANLVALTLLHDLSTRLLAVDRLETLLQEIMDAAVVIVKAQRGTLQLIEGDSLRIVAHHGHERPFLEYFAANGNRPSVCGEAMQQGGRVIVADVELSPLFGGTASLQVLRDAGVRAVQSTPLLARQGRLLGILTTQWSQPHVPDEHDLWRIDLLARQAADLIEHRQAEEALWTAHEDLLARAEQLRTLNDSLQVQQRRLEEANKTLREQEAELSDKTEALIESEERYRTLFETAPDAVVVWKDGRFLDVNDAARRLVGADASAGLASHGVLDFFQPCDRNQTDERMRLALAGRTLPVRETALRRLDGREILVELHSAPVDFQGEKAIQTVVRDVTERKQAEEALRKLNATLESKVAQRTAELEKERRRLYDVLEAIPAMVCLLTPDYHVAFANRSFREGFGEANGRHCYEFCYGRTEPCEFCETYHVLKTGRPHRWEVAAADGHTIIEAHDFPFTDVDGSPLILEMDIDITERKRAEAGLRGLNETLSHRARQLQKLTLELTQAEERERRRIAQVLHEDLQQQIAGAKFHLSMIRGRTQDDRQQAEIDHVGEMLTNAIEESRRLSHDLSPAMLHMNDLAEALRWLARRVHTHHGLTAHVHAAKEMILESEVLTIFLLRAAQELLFNVAKHARVGEAVLRVRRLGRHVCLSVCDQGRGFDPRELKETPGFGLLSLRERTELLGGRLGIKSVLGRGSRLRIVVPDGLNPRDGRGSAQGVPVGTPSTPACPPAVSGVLRVLLVDDHDLVRQGLASLVQESPDIRVVGEAANGREAITLACALRPDVVIMDVYMPLMTGEEATRQIKRHLPKTRVIALSMHDEPDKREMMYQAGAESYVLKTASPAELCAAIRGPQDTM